MVYYSNLIEYYRYITVILLYIIVYYGILQYSYCILLNITGILQVILLYIIEYYRYITDVIVIRCKKFTHT